MKGNESPRDKNSDEKIGDTDATLLNLPEHYFELMTRGSKLAMQGDFSLATQHFAEAQSEISQIIQRLFELPKNEQATKWQVITILWAFKVIKSVFYWFLAKGEKAKNPADKKNLLLAAMGAQQVGINLVASFKTLDQVLTGKNRELLMLLAEAIQNFEERQRILEKELQAQGIEIPHLVQD